MDYFQFLFLAGAGLLVLVRSIRGWRMGVVRQLVDFTALGLGYAGAIVATRVTPGLLHRLGYPDLVVSVMAGTIAGGVIYFGLTGAASRVCKSTREQTLGLARLGYGAGGSVLGGLSALLTVWMFVLGIRCLGTVAQAEVAMARTPQARLAGMTPGPMAEGLARLKVSLDTGLVGSLVKGSDPVPDRVYEILRKITQVVSSVDSMRRFASFPGTRELSENPRIIALQRDPQIAQQALHGNVMALLGNPKIAAAVNDPVLESMVKSFELEKALDYALCSSGKVGGN